MAIVLFDNVNRKGLYPFTLTKAVGGLRMGILSIRERWEQLTGQPVYIHTEKYLQPLYSLPGNEEHLWIDAAILPDDTSVDRILSLHAGSCLADEAGMIAGRGVIHFNAFDAAKPTQFFPDMVTHPVMRRLMHPWQCIQWNDEMLRKDFSALTKGRNSQPIPSTVTALNPSNIFIEEGAKLQYCMLNATTGPVYIGKNAEIMEGSVVRGPFAMAEYAVLKLNSRIYGATTLGPYCLGGGEMKNAILMGYSNKAHDGYLGDSVIGEWCNFGAGSANSNVRNNAGEVKVWDMASEKYTVVGHKFGMVMGDYSRIAINSAINTGSMIGISCNVFGAGLLPTIIPNFSWGVTGTRYEFAKALQDIDNWKQMKQQHLTETETSVLQYIFDSLTV